MRRRIDPESTYQDPSEPIHSVVFSFRQTQYNFNIDLVFCYRCSVLREHKTKCYFTDQTKPLYKYYYLNNCNFIAFRIIVCKTRTQNVHKGINKQDLAEPTNTATILSLIIQQIVKKLREKFRYTTVFLTLNEWI